jgi:hypothetical protein
MEGFTNHLIGTNYTTLRRKCNSIVPLIRGQDGFTNRLHSHIVKNSP